MGRDGLCVCEASANTLDRGASAFPEPPIPPADTAASTSLRADPLAPLLAQVAGGDRAALRRLYDATSARLFGVCLRILGDRGESEDVLQEVYLAVWRRAAAFDPARASGAAWLTAITRNRAIDRLRARNPLRGAQDISTVEAADPAEDAEAGLLRTDEGLRLHACLSALRAEEASAIRTAFLGGLTYEAVAARSGKPVGTVKSWIRRGLVRLRECLER